MSFDRTLLYTAPTDATVPVFQPQSSDVDLLVRCVDLTTLAGDDTHARVQALCHKAVAHNVAAVCVYPAFIGTAREALQGTDIKLAAVAGGFPHGLSPLPARLLEISESVAAGADEVDVVIQRAHALEGNWEALFDEVLAMKQACSGAKLKVILATGELGSPEVVARAAMASLMAGADFIKTSTGKEAVNAELGSGAVMLRAIHHYERATGRKAGFKAAGGIRTKQQALEWAALVRSVLGESWLNAGLFRIGASSLLDELV